MSRILIVDDAEIMRDMLRGILETAGYNIVGEAGDGEQALNEYQRLKPDLVIMDISMPRMDGIHALKFIKAYDPKAKVVMCSAMGQQEMVIDAIELGAKEFIVKPFHAEAVLNIISRVLRD